MTFAGTVRPGIWHAKEASHNPGQRHPQWTTPNWRRRSLQHFPENRVGIRFGNKFRRIVRTALICQAGQGAHLPP
jgi:hypothetical protein